MARFSLLRLPEKMIRHSTWRNLFSRKPQIFELTVIAGILYSPEDFNTLSSKLRVFFACISYVQLLKIY